MTLYKGYIRTKDKKSMETLRGRTQFSTLEQVQGYDGYAGMLADDTILIDIDDGAQAEILMNIVEQLQLNCRVYQTSRGKHFLFKNHQVTRNRTHVPLAVGLTADIKLGSKTSYEIIKIGGQERFIEWDIEPGAEYQELPKWLQPVKTSADFLDMEAGDGRNDALFKYILTLTGNDMTVEETRECIRLMNQYVLKEPLEESELETILRDEAFQKPVFFIGSTFQFDKFAHWMKQNSHVVKINDQLHIYHDGVYDSDPERIEAEMIETIPFLKQTQRNEVMKYLRLIVEERQASDARYIGFRNGVLDMSNVKAGLREYTPDLVLTNLIPWDYVPDAYSELTDQTLNKLACNDPAIRALLEECVGYCFYRRNELGKAFILTGDRANGKSTFLDMVKNVLGERNISALDLKELGDRFNTAMIFGKLANIGDDIGDDFLQGSQVAMFKKVATGNRIKGEYKGQTPFEFNPYVKMLFSANNIPRMRDKTGAVLRRLVIIPFNHTFSKADPDYDAMIKYRLVEQDAAEYLIRLGVAGLQRVILNQEFTQSGKVQEQLDEYEEENNPLIGFLKENGTETILNQPTSEVYRRYQIFCSENGMQPMSNTVFSKQLNKRLRTDVKVVKLNGKVCRIFVKG